MTAPTIRRRRTILALACAIVLMLLGATICRLFVWPSLPTPPARVDAIIELGGEGWRDDVALALARQGRAPILVQSTTEGDTQCLPPVPGVEIRCFHAEPNTTQGEARYIGRAAAEGHWHSVILVTSRDHAWRARLWVKRCFPGEVYVVTSHLPPLLWFRQIPYQSVATIKALTVNRSC